MDPKNSSSDMDQFYAQVAVIKALMADIKDLQSRLEANNERTKTAVRTAQVHELREKMQQDANTISKEAEQIKSYLKQLDAENAAAMKKKGQGKGSASERTRTAVTGALKKKLKESMDEFQELRERLMADYRETVERRVYTVTGEHATEEQIDHMIDEGEGEMIFQKAIMEQGRGYVMDTVAELRERRDAVLELEKSLLELHQVFLDMAVLVEAQGQMIDNIENQVRCRFTPGRILVFDGSFPVAGSGAGMPRPSRHHRSFSWYPVRYIVSHGILFGIFCRMVPPVVSFHHCVPRPNHGILHAFSRAHYKIITCHEMSALFSRHQAHYTISDLFYR